MIEKLNGNLIITLGALGSLLVTKDVETMIPCPACEGRRNHGSRRFLRRNIGGRAACRFIYLGSGKAGDGCRDDHGSSAVGAQPSMPTRRELDEMCKGCNCEITGELL